MALKRTTLKSLIEHFNAENVTRLDPKHGGWSEVYHVEIPDGAAWDDLAESYDAVLGDKGLLKQFGNRGMQIIVSIRTEEGEDKYSSMSFARNPKSSLNHAYDESIKHGSAYRSSYVVGVYLYLR